MLSDVLYSQKVEPEVGLTTVRVAQASSVQLHVVWISTTSWSLSTNHVYTSALGNNIFTSIVVQ